MGALAAVSAHELLATRDCRTPACNGEATTPGGLCSYCARVEERRRELAIRAWRRLVRTLDPPAEAACSPLTFQAVAAALADYAVIGDPSVEQLARASRSCARTVQLALAALEEHGLIVRDTRGGRGRPSRYALRRPARPRQPNRLRSGE